MENKIILLQKAHSAGLIATLIDATQAREFERTLTIKKIVTSSLPICEMVRYVGMRQIAIALDIQLTRLVASLNNKWNIAETQIKIIVEDLIDKYPNESIEDFILCFRKGRTGEYGPIMNLDVSVICEWMKKYLDEKYIVIEQELRKEKDTPYEKPTPTEEGPGYKAFKEYAQSLREGSKVPGMTDADYRKYGQENPIRKSVTSGMKYFKVREYEVYASTQEHAEELFEKMIKHGMLKP